MKKLRQETVSKLRKELAAPFGIRGTNTSNSRIDKNNVMEIPFYNIDPLYDMRDSEWGSRLVATVTAAASRAWIKCRCFRETMPGGFSQERPVITALSLVCTNGDSFDEIRSAVLASNPVSDYNIRFRPHRMQYEFAFVGHTVERTFREGEYSAMYVKPLFSVTAKESTLARIDNEVLSELKKQGLDPKEKNNKVMELHDEVSAFYLQHLERTLEPDGHAEMETFRHIYDTNFDYYHTEAIIGHLREQFIRKLTRFAAGLPEMK